MQMHWVFHPDYEPVMVDEQEYHQLLANGWVDSPAKFPVSRGTEKEESEVQNYALTADEKQALREEVKEEVKAEKKAKNKGK